MRFKYKNLFTKIVYMLIDLACIYSAIAIASLIRYRTIPFDVNFFNILLNNKNPFQFIFAFWMVTILLCVNSNSLYQTRRERSEGFEVWLVFKSIFTAAVIVVFVIYGLKIEGFPRTIFTIGTVLSFVFLSLWRIIKRVFINYLVRQGYNNFNVLIIGAGKVGQALQNEIKSKPGLGLRVAGFLDDFKTYDPRYPDVKILGKVSNFIRVARREFINEIFITIHEDNDAFLTLLEQAKVFRIAVRVIPYGFELVSGEFSKYNIGIIPVLEYSSSMPFRKQAGKRIFDFIIGLIGIIILLPIFLLIAILIKIDSKGPVFYKSKRYGRNGRIFNMYKFRSMRDNAEHLIKEIKHKNEADGPIFKIKKDPRITKFGKTMRKYSLDELPQIINVLKGDMSLVGPRPLPIDQIEKEDLKQLKRLEVRPGITGLWQIKGRSDLSFTKLVKWDTWYINNWSFWLDINILIWTFPVVIKGKGAY